MIELLPCVRRCPAGLYAVIGTYVARLSNRHGWPLQRFEMDGEIDAVRNPATVSTSEHPSLSEKLFSCDLIWVCTLVPHLGLGKIKRMVPC